MDPTEAERQRQLQQHQGATKTMPTKLCQDFFRKGMEPNFKEPVFQKLVFLRLLRTVSLAYVEAAKSREVGGGGGMSG